MIDLFSVLNSIKLLKLETKIKCFLKVCPLVFFHQLNLLVVIVFQKNTNWF